MDTFSAMQIVMMTMQGLTMFAALLFASFSAMQVPERPAPPPVRPPLRGRRYSGLGRAAHLALGGRGH